MIWTQSATFQEKGSFAAFVSPARQAVGDKIPLSELSKRDRTPAHTESAIALQSLLSFGIF